MSSTKGVDEEPLVVQYTPMKPRTNLIHSLLSTGVAAIRPYAPQLIPVLVCAVFIPFIVILSISAGWFVWTNLSVSWEIPLYLQYGDGVPPYAHVELPRMIPQQRYDISVHLNLPLSNSNIALGNFMTNLSLETMSNKTVVSVRRAAIAAPTSRFSYFFDAKRTEIKVPLLQSFASPVSRLVGTVQVGRRDHWRTLGTGEGRELSVISASLRGLAVPHGIRGLAIRFPVTASLLASGLFLVILSTLLAGCILPLVIPKQAEDQKTFVKPEPQVQSKLDNDVSTSRRPPSRSPSRSAEREIKTESDDVKTEESESSDHTVQIRHRRSRPYPGTSDDSSDG